MALEGGPLELRCHVHAGRGLQVHARTAPRPDATRRGLGLRSLIAHGIWFGGGRDQVGRLALACTTTTLLLTVRLATGKAVPVPPSNLSELEPTSLGGALARAMLLTAVTRATDGKLRTAATAQLKTEGFDAAIV